MTLVRISNRLLSACLLVAFLSTAMVEAGAQAPTSSSGTTAPSRRESQAGEPVPALEKPSDPQLVIPDAPGQRTQSNGQNNGQGKPVGTAAAPDPSEDGIPSSTTSGAAVAPIKQKRVKTFSIRTALLVGGIVAVGLVAGLTLATSAHP